MSTDTSFRRLAVALLAGHAVVSAFVAIHCFPYGLTTEADGYQIVAKELLSGKVVTDGFHPLLYPLLAAPLVALLGDALIACRLLSVVAALLFLGASVVLARRLGSPQAAVWTFAVLLPNSVVATLAPQAVSDVLAAAAMALALERLAAWTCSGGRGFAAAALAAGVASAVRVPSTIVVVVVALAGAVAAGSWRARSMRVVVAGLGWAVAHVPQWVAFAATGTPLLGARSETQFALKYLAHWDINRMPTDEPGAVWARLLQDWPGIVHWWAADAWSCLTEELPRMLTGVAMPAPLALLFAFFLVCFVIRGAGRARGGAWPAWVALAHVAFVALAFRPDPRVLLPLVCPCVALAAAGMPAIVLRWPALLGLAVACSLPSAYAQLAAQDAGPEVVLAKRLERELRPGIVGSTWLLMRAELGVPTFFLGPPPGPLPPAAAWARAREFVARSACDFVVVGRTTAPHLYQSLREVSVPPDARVIADEPGVLVLSFGAPSGIRGTLDLDPGAGTGDARRLHYRGGLGGDDPPVRVGVLVVGPDGSRQMVELQRIDDGWAAMWTPPAACHLIVYATTSRGQVLRGPELDVVGPPR